MRSLIVLAAACACAPEAGALSISPPRGRIASSPNGQFVFVLVAPWYGTDPDPDADAIRAKCKASGMYRRGEWDAPLWTLHVTPAWGRFFASNDGAHLAVYDGVQFAAATSYDFVDTGSPDPSAARRKRVLAVPAFTLYANGKAVRTLFARDLIGTADGARANGLLGSAEFRADGWFHVTSGDGNRTVWNPATGDRIEGHGAPPEPEPWPTRLTEPVVLIPVAVGAQAVLAFVVYRRVRRRVAA